MEVHINLRYQQSFSTVQFKYSTRSFAYQVMAVTSHGDSEVAVIVGGPLDSGNHCPSKPQLTMLGRREIFVSWLPPVQPMGRIMKYELKQNGQVNQFFSV